MRVKEERTFSRSINGSIVLTKRSKVIGIVEEAEAEDEDEDKDEDEDEDDDEDEEEEGTVPRFCFAFSLEDAIAFSAKCLVTCAAKD
jgi:hypothetical protein